MFEIKQLPFSIPKDMKPFHAIQQYKCQIMTCLKKAQSSFDYEGEQLIYVVCWNHNLLIMEGDLTTQMFLSSTLWNYSDILHFLYIISSINSQD